ncbi:MAG: tetratricopeptide repeat protein [Actinomycetota bacterium]
MLNSLLIFMVLTATACLPEQDRKVDDCPREATRFAQVRQKAAAKDPVAETALASCYDLGLHVHPDGREWIRLLTEAAGQGYAHAQYEVGRIYLYGRGVPADYPRALRWETRAAEQGDSRAQRDLAFMYERGFGVPADPAKAAEWNKKAAAQGNAEAQVHLGHALDEGMGVPANPAEARKWYAKAARQNQAQAQLQLARKFAEAPDCANAIHWYEQASGHGETTAMYELGRLYMSGRCKSNPSLALKWYTIGARFGSVESRAAAETLAKSLSPGASKQAQDAAGRWIKIHSDAQPDEDSEDGR